MKPADNGILPIRQISPRVWGGISTEVFINAKQASALLHLSAKTLLRFARQGNRPSPSLDGKDPQAMAVLGIRALRLGSRTRKFSDERPVPKFKEKMNAGTISEWLSHNDHTQGRN